jgi:hypothetical protein
VTDRNRQVAGLSLLAVVVCLGTAGGCADSATNVPAARHNNPLAHDAVTRQEFFDHAIDNLHRLEQFQPQAMLDQIRQQLNESVDWQREVDWQRDPLLEALPDQVRDMEVLRALDDLRLNVYDATHLQETVTLQSASRFAVGGASAELDRANLLFDWVVRNIQLTPPGELRSRDGKPLPIGHFPMEILFFGRGESIDRAWIFMLLCRQQGLDAVLLALPPLNANGPPRPWVVGVMIDDQMYLYDPTLGLPLPGKHAQGVATLAQVAVDDSLLRQLDVDEQHPYPVKSTDLVHLTALIDASPGYLSRRMRVLEGKLAGEDKIVLADSPSRVADRARHFPQITDVRLWGLPYERILLRFAPQYRETTITALNEEMLPYRLDLLPPEYQAPAINLQRGRVLHLKGLLAAEEGEPSANRFYQNARLADQDIDSAALNETQRAILHRAKDDASYWLGLVAYDRGRFSTAIDHLQKRTLDADQNSRWANGARYNIARAHEAQGQWEQAVELYQSMTDPQRHGNLLRARFLKARHREPDAEQKPSPANETEPSPDQSEAPADQRATST